MHWNLNRFIRNCKITGVWEKRASLSYGYYTNIHKKEYAWDSNHYLFYNRLGIAWIQQKKSLFIYVYMYVSVFTISVVLWLAGRPAFIQFDCYCIRSHMHPVLLFDQQQNGVAPVLCYIGLNWQSLRYFLMQCALVQSFLVVLSND